jgi:hypothetical protein
MSFIADARRVMMPVRIYGAGPSNEPEYWERYLGRVNVNRRCGEMFGPVFDQYDIVWIVTAHGTVYHLTRDKNLLQALVDANVHGNIEVHARHGMDGVV